ncbi:MAG TPA: IS5 family transposase [Micromonosporaceae bacterium]|nr:IS5 family transposase [Micromonosporaceae bacterium]
MRAGGRGGRWRDHRQVIKAILWKVRTGAPWRDLPERYGPWKTAHERLRMWTADGRWDRILAVVVVKDDGLGPLEDNIALVVSVDSTSVRAHQHAAGAPEKRGCAARVEALAVEGECLGRSRGGLTSKIHLAVDAFGLPLAVILTPGQAGDNPWLLPLLDDVTDLRIDGRRVRVGRVLADKGIRASLHAESVAGQEGQDHDPGAAEPTRPVRRRLGGRTPRWCCHTRPIRTRRWCVPR